MPDEITVRQWQELYRAGAFVQDDSDVRELAGWTDFYDPLANRKVQALAKLVMGITHPLILDKYRVYFVEHEPGEGPRHASVCFDPLTGEWSKRMFSVGLGGPLNREKWALFTQRYGEGEAEFECGHIRRMIHYIHAMAGELQQDIKPAFWPEMEAAQQFVFTRLPGCVYLVLRREGEHSYSTWERTTGRRVTLHVARRPEDAPPGFQAQDAVPVCGLYVFPQKDDEKSPQIAAVSKKKSHKKEAER